MLEMLFTDVTDLAATDSQAAIAIATGDLVSVTFALVVVGCLIGLGQIGVVVYGINKMIASNDTRNRHHKKALKDRAKRHKRAMKAETGRHKEAMAAISAQDEAHQRRHDRAMKALDALIRNTGRRNRPIPAR